MKRALLLLTLLALVGAARAAPVYDYEGNNPPRYAAPREGERHAVALVLGSGGRRGFAHAGVLRVLEGAGIKPDLIVGVSIGSVIGSLYAGGMSAAEVERLALELDLSALTDLSWIRWGRVKGQRLQDFVNTRARQRPLEALGTRFVVVATREQDNALTIFNRGDTGVAVRASSAVPGRFYPVCINGVNYIDGDVASPVPVRVARTLGAQVVIAVDISTRLDKIPPEAPADWVKRDRERRVQIDAEVKGADVLIHPEMPYYAGTSSAYRQRTIAAAAEATRAALPRITAAVAKVRTSAPPATATTSPTLPAPPAAR
ncbi:MAG: patatin-like phospholipase family protein [Betaproteobacteria bacterium]|nr:patatin-like phospholipase family protein [Betaproteobacteria bacterium]